jgi:two-component system, LytTR family, sensor kinase
MIQFFVKNSLPQNVTESPVSTGIGILNAQKRLSLLYPNQFELAIIPTETTFLVDLKIKLPA